MEMCMTLCDRCDLFFIFYPYEEHSATVLFRYIDDLRLMYRYFSSSSSSSFFILFVYFYIYIGHSDGPLAV